MLVFWISLALMIGVNIASANINEEEYCRISKSNIVCRNPTCSTSIKCEKVLKSDHLTDEERQAILDEHNILRQKQALQKERHNPIPASNMNMLGYSLEIEHLAQCWMNSCDFSHDPGRGSPNYTSQGQNLFLAWAHPHLNYSKETLKHAVRHWYNEVKDFHDGNYFSGDKNFKKTGHYTQVVWANTTLIGCGRTIFKLYNKIENRQDEYVIIGCNYYSPGNIPGHNMFKKGKACSDCKYCNRDYVGLCGKTPGFPVDPNFNSSGCNTVVSFASVVFLALFLQKILY